MLLEYMIGHTGLIHIELVRSSAWATTMAVLRYMFTSLPGSLLHPVGMVVICSCWVLAAVLGFQVRMHRTNFGAVSQPGDPLLEGRSSRRKRHHQVAAGLYTATIAFTLCAMFNTFLRTGRLFPGPHLYGAAILICLLSFNVGMVPHMSSSERVRIAHSVVGAAVILLLLPQFLSGLKISIALLS